MDYSLMMQLVAEFLGTMLIVTIGNGTVAAVSLKGSKAHGAGWLTIAVGYGIAVGLPVLMFGAVSGAHLNPAMTIAQAVTGMFTWSLVLPYICAQLLGAAVGQLIVWVVFKPQYDATEDPEAILGTFSTSAMTPVSYFFSEFFGTMILALGVFASLKMPWGAKNPAAATLMIVPLLIGLVTSFGGASGPALNPARDLMPRLLHQFLPIPHKGTSHWGTSWIPVVSPILGAIVGTLIFQLFVA